MPAALLASLLGVVSAAVWGAGDFCGGVASKRSPVLGVLVLGSASGLAVILAAALLLGEAAPPARALAWAAAAGASGAAGLAALYRGLSVGRMAVVAPVSAVMAAAVPATIGALSEGVPPAAKLLGFALALSGIWLVARTEKGTGAGGSGLWLGLLAGVGFGGFMAFMHAGAAAGGGAFWPLSAARATSCALVAAAALLRRRPVRPEPAGLRLALLSGVLDAGGNAFFVLSGRLGRLDAAAVLASMYPASTVLLAALVLHEPVTRPQLAGIAALLLAIALIAA